jgi:HEAT repeat protein
MKGTGLGMILLVAVAAVSGACGRAGDRPKLTASEEALFFGPLDPHADEPMEERVRRLVREIRGGSSRDAYLAGLQALANLGPEAIPHLGRFIPEGFTPGASGGADPYLVDNICEVLGRIGHPAAEPHLIRAVACPTEFVRIKALQVLAGLASPASVEVALPYLQSDNEALSLAALRVLLAAGTPEALRAVAEASERFPLPLRVEAIEGVAAAGFAPAIESVRRFAAEVGPFFRLSAGQALLDLGRTEEGMEILREGLASPREDVRFRALEILALRKEPEAFDPLRRALEEETELETRRVAAIGIRLSGRGPWELLLRIRQDPAWLIRLQGNRALAERDPEAALGLFVEDLESGDPERRKDAIRVFRYFHDPAGARALVSLYGRTADTFEARMILLTLAKMRDAAAIPLFLDVIRNDRRAIRRNGEAPEGADIDLSETAASYLPNFRELCFGPIVEAYRDCEDRTTRRVLADAVSGTRHPETLRCLGELYRLEPDPSLRLRILQMGRSLRDQAAFLLAPEVEPPGAGGSEE